jgi:hypothetical protein
MPEYRVVVAVVVELVAVVGDIVVASNVAAVVCSVDMVVGVVGVAYDGYCYRERIGCHVHHYLHIRFVVIEVETHYDMLLMEFSLHIHFHDYHKLDKALIH